MQVSRRRSCGRSVVVTAAAVLAAAVSVAGAQAADVSGPSGSSGSSDPSGAPGSVGSVALSSTASTGSGDRGGSAGAARTATVDDDAVDFVVAISVDGLKPTVIRRLGPEGVPSLYRMMRRGASTLNARNLVEQTVTLPNHTSMVTSRRMEPSAGGHGVYFNSDQGTTVHEHAEDDYVDSMFDVAHDRGLRASLYVSKDKFHTLDRSWNEVYGADDAVGGDQGRDKIDRFFLDDEPTNVTRLVRRLVKRPDHISFLHLAYPDVAGHEHGWGSPEYLDAVRAADHQVGRILDRIEDHRRLRRHVNVILTSDHGGTGYGHGNPSVAANYRVPFMVWGAGVARGRNLYVLNADTRINPGTGRPDYSGTQPIRNGEVGNLVLDLLDMPPIPDSLFNSKRDLAVR